LITALPTSNHANLPDTGFEPWRVPRRDGAVCRIPMHTEPAAEEAAGMQARSKRGKTRCTRTVLRIPDLEQSKTAVLNSLPAKTSQESYAHAIDEFIAW